MTPVPWVQNILTEGGSGRIVGTVELPSHLRSDPQNPEESRGHALLPDIFEMSIGREVDPAISPERRYIHSTRTIADALEQGSGLAFLPAFPAVPAPVSGHQRQAVQAEVGRRA